MRVAVYTIAKNEEQFVQGWYESAKDADYLLIADTGSSDNTVKKAKDLGINVIQISINPWRFDDARNASLAQIPSNIDYCIALDMDEVLLPGWKEELEKAFESKITRPRYKYTWSWKDKEETVPDLQYGADKIHSRQGYRWKHPVHEVLSADRMQETQDWYDLEIHHHPDKTKSRSHYLDLLKLSTIEDPNDDRNAHYFARELLNNGLRELAAEEFKRHLELPSSQWEAERSASYRYLAMCEPEKAREHLINAIKEDPSRRESRIKYATYLYHHKEWESCYNVCLEALEIKDKPLDYLCEGYAWGSLPYDLASISAWNLGMVEKAIEYGKVALELDPENERLSSNLLHFEQSLAEKTD